MEDAGAGLLLLTEGRRLAGYDEPLPPPLLPLPPLMPLFPVDVLAHENIPALLVETLEKSRLLPRTILCAVATMVYIFNVWSWSWIESLESVLDRVVAGIVKCSM